MCSADNIHPNAGPFVVAAGAILGICAALLWTAQGSLVLGYPTEADKGRYIGIFWAIFNLGGVVGAAVSLGQNFDSKVGLAYIRLYMMLTLACRPMLVSGDVYFLSLDTTNEAFFHHH